MLKKIIKQKLIKTNKINKTKLTNIKLGKKFIYFCLTIIITLGISISSQSILAEWVNPYYVRCVCTH